MAILPPSPPSIRIEKGQFFLSSIVDTPSDPPSIIAKMVEFFKELNPAEVKTLKTQEVVDQLWNKALKLDSPHLLLEFVRHGWTPKLRTSQHAFSLDCPISWGWVAFNMNAPACFDFIMKLPDLKKEFIKDAKTLPIIQEVLKSTHSFPSKWEPVFAQTSLLENRFEGGGTFLHEITKARLWHVEEQNATENNWDNGFLRKDGQLRTGPWFDWAQKNATRLVDRLDLKKQTAFQADSDFEPHCAHYLESIRVLIEKSLYDQNVGEVSTQKIKTRRL